MAESTQTHTAGDAAITLPLFSLNAADLRNRVARLAEIIDARDGIQVDLNADAAEMIIHDADRETVKQVRRLARDCGIATTPEDLKSMAMAWQAVVARDQTSDDYSDA